jgi:allantoate deiminase
MTTSATNTTPNTTSAASNSHSSDSIRRAASRALNRCDELAACTDRAGELTRLFCTPAMHAAHEKLRGWMQAAQLETRTDAAGNMIGSRRSNSHNAKTLFIGSHIDTVVNAGKYDGPLGVMLGLALAELANEAGLQLPFQLDVLAFSEEEGVRYQTPYIGSRAIVGDLPPELLSRKDAAGITLADALRNFGCDPNQIVSAAIDGRSVIAYLEPHIEQGPVLEREQLPVGIVTGIAGQTRATFQFTGKAGHAGTVPMDCRHDALAAAAQFILAVEELACCRDDLVATVGQIETIPNVSNVIPGEVILRLDVRHQNDDQRDAAFRELTHQAALIAEEREIEFDMTAVQHHPAIQCDDEQTNLLEQSIIDAGVKPFRLPSGAGHDAVIMSKRFPISMLFIRCAGGISHHPEESVTEADVAVALDVLWRTVLKLAAQTASQPA